MQDRLIAAIDIGSSKVCVTVAAYDPAGNSRYVGHGSVPSDGVAGGQILQPDALVQSLEDALDEARRLGAANLSEAYVSVSGVTLSAHEREGRVELGAATAFTQADVMRALPDTTQYDTRTQVTVHRVVQIIRVDGEEVDDPTGRRGRVLSVRTRDYTAPRGLVDGLAAAADRARCRVQAIVPAGVAAGAGALTDGERQLGVAVVDIGYMSSDVAVYCAGALHGLMTIPIGGYHLTSDLAQLLDIPFADAERLKRVYGTMNLLDALDIELGARTIAGWQRQARSGDPPRDAVQTIVGARMIELLRALADRFEAERLEDALLAGVVLTGGGAKLAGIDEVARRAVGMEVRVGGVVAGDGFPSIPDPAAVASIGLARYCISRASGAAARRPSHRGTGSAAHGARPLANWATHEERRVGSVLVADNRRPVERSWGRSVTRWMREFIPARGG